MQDIAGLRIVEELSLTQQTLLAKSIVDLFPRSKLIDRREKANLGYRAIHVIARIDQYPVEIQIRTRLQDVWAQAMERLADEAGRDVRYGAVPQSHREMIELLLEAADELAQVEDLVDKTVRPDQQHPRRASFGQREFLLEKLKAQRLSTEIDTQVANFRRFLQRLTVKK